MSENVILVTGASRGIGRAIALRAGRAGWSVAVNYHEDEAGAVAVRDALLAGDTRAITVQADVGDLQAVARMVETIATELGPVTALVNNAGVLVDGGLDESSWEDWAHVIRVNLSGPFLVAQACVPMMRAVGFGRIVNVLSTTGFQGGGPHSYVASKAGLWGLTMSLARELASHNITVNAVTPGIIDTTFYDAGVRALYQAQAKRIVPTGRLGDPDEVAEVVELLLANKYMTGANIAVTGGALML